MRPSETPCAPITFCTPWHGIRRAVVHRYLLHLQGNQTQISSVIIGFDAALAIKRHSMLATPRMGCLNLRREFVSGRGDDAALAIHRDADSARRLPTIRSVAQWPRESCPVIACQRAAGPQQRPPRPTPWMGFELNTTPRCANSAPQASHRHHAYRRTK